MLIYFIYYLSIKVPNTTPLLKRAVFNPYY